MWSFIAKIRLKDDIIVKPINPHPILRPINYHSILRPICARNNIQINKNKAPAIIRS